MFLVVMKIISPLIVQYRTPCFLNYLSTHLFLVAVPISS